MARLFQTLQQQANNTDILYPKSNPLTKTGKRVMASMRKSYGKRAEEVFYGSIKKGVKGSKRWHK